MLLAPMGLATPLAVMVGMGRGAEQGILFKSSEALQRMGDVTQVVLDKTGTITRGSLSVTDVIPTADYSRERVLELGRLARACQRTSAGRRHCGRSGRVRHDALT
ncbi:MAG: hypothetical protein R3C56_15780 [Pirellulaceae bacterium]